MQFKITFFPPSNFWVYALLSRTREKTASMNCDVQFVNGIFPNGHEEILKNLIRVSVSVQNHSETLTRFSISEKNRSESEVNDILTKAGWLLLDYFTD